MHVEFVNLGMVLRSSGKRILAGVTGQVRHGRLTAVMGPSGAGELAAQTSCAHLFWPDASALQCLRPWGACLYCAECSWQPSGSVKGAMCAHAQRSLDGASSCAPMVRQLSGSGKAGLHGAGKTTLLNTLAGKNSTGKVTGRVYINGRLDRLERYRRISGFVPQVTLACMACWHVMRRGFSTHLVRSALSCQCLHAPISFAVHRLMWTLSKTELFHIDDGCCSRLLVQHVRQGK